VNLAPIVSIPPVGLHVARSAGFIVFFISNWAD
jgi:hypothetical protein